MPKLWEPYDIPIIGLAGEPNSGKTMWGLTIDPNCLQWNSDPTTLVWDTEGSSVSYVGALNFDRVDITANAVKTDSVDSSLKIFNTWRTSMVSLPTGKYQVCMLDVVSDVESGLAIYMKAHPNEYGYTANQFAKSGGLFWGAVKTEWKRLLMMATQKCETLVLTMHMRAEFKGASPTGRRIPMGKDTIMDVTSLYMTLVRETKTLAKQVSQRPSGICKWPGGKSRLVRIDPVTMQPQQLLPPFLEDASPSGIRKYLAAPPDFDNLQISEQARPDIIMSEDDRLAMLATIAVEDNARAQAELTRVELECEIRNEKKGGVSGIMNDLKSRLLAIVSLEEAKGLLKERYGCNRLIELKPDQAKDLEQHIGTLGN